MIVCERVRTCFAAKKVCLKPKVSQLLFAGSADPGRRFSQRNHGMARTIQKPMQTGRLRRQNIPSYYGLLSR